MDGRSGGRHGRPKAVGIGTPWPGSTAPRLSANGGGLSTAQRLVLANGKGPDSNALLACFGAKGGRGLPGYAYSAALKGANWWGPMLRSETGWFAARPGNGGAGLRRWPLQRGLPDPKEPPPILIGGAGFSGTAPPARQGSGAETGREKCIGKKRLHTPAFLRDDLSAGLAPSCRATFDLVGAGRGAFRSYDGRRAPVSGPMKLGSWNGETLSSGKNSWLAVCDLWSRVVF